MATQRWVASTADEGALRLIYSRGREGGSAPTAYAMVSPVPARVIGARRDGVSAITLDRGLPADGGDAMPWLMASAKTLSYAVNMAVLRHAARQGAGDVIFVSTDGYVLEGPRSTVVIATDGDQGGGNPCLLTPPPWYPILREPRNKRSSKWPARKATTATTVPYASPISSIPKVFGWYRA